MADNVMVHLQTRRQQVVATKIMKMNKSLAEFVDIDQDERSRIACADSGTRESWLSSTTPADVTNTESRRNSDSKSSEDDLPQGDSGRDYCEIFTRAASLLRKSLSLQDSGGVVFLDTAPKSSDGISAKCTVKTGGGSKRDRCNRRTDSSQPRRVPSDDTEDEYHGRQAAVMLACSVCEESFQRSNNACILHENRPSNISVKTLLKFIKKAPAGSIWHYPELRSKTTGGRRSPSDPRAHGNVEESEIRTLFSHLPGSHEIIFVPFWNTHCSRWSVCIVYALAKERSFSYEIDYYFCRAFCNCVKAEVDRRTVTLSDQQKGEFIGSVSHELRSPLHSILASCELLDETEMTNFQNSLVDTAQSCANTLLDTIQMILEYSKVNAFTASKTAEKLNVKPNMVKGGIEPLLSIYSHVNVALVAEELIEGVTTGHLAKRESGMQTGSPRDGGKHKVLESSLEVPGSPVEVILDVSPPRDWTFVTQPGAYRRILMNIFGNSLKYTDHGYVKIFLRCDEPKESDPDPTKVTVLLSVVDSGKGIGKNYMTNKLFTSFAQENPLAPGTGLGLSLVKSLVDMMNGQIEVHSEINHGTTVTVRIPMQRTISDAGRGAYHKPNMEDIQALREIQPRPQIVNFRQDMLPEDSPNKREAYDMQKHALAAYVNGWYAIEALDHWDMKTRPDVILVDEIHLKALTKHLDTLEAFDAMVLAFCSDRSRTTAITNAFKYPKLHVISKPFGPFKLAKALKIALDNRGTEASPCGAVNLELEAASGKSEQSKPIIRRTMSPMQGLPHSDRSRNPLSGQTLEIVEGFPFPTMRLTPAPPAPIPSMPATACGQGMVEPPLRRLMTSDVLLSQHGTTEKHNDLVRSVSDGALNHKQVVHKPKMLLVDDNEINLKLLQTMLIRRGFKDLVLARDGKQAVDRYREALHNSEGFHIIWMDISMPVMDGFEATTLIRQIEGEVAAKHTENTSPAIQSLIIALTGNASAADQTSAFTAGIDLYMTKPVSLRDISDVMKTWEESSATHGAEGARNAVLEANVKDG